MEEKKKLQNPYVKSMLSEAGAICIAIVFFFVLYRLQGIGAAIGRLASILRPFVIGFAIAYILKPVCKALERWTERLFKGRYPGAVKGISVALSFAFAMLLVYILISMIVPQMYTSIISLSNTLPGQVEALYERVEEIFYDNQTLLSYVDTTYESMVETFTDWIRNTVLPSMKSVVGGVGSGVKTFVISVKDIVIGLVVSVYALAARKNVVRRVKMITYSILPARWADLLADEVNFADRMFSGFMSGKLLDSAIIGALCYIFCAITSMPNSLLVSAVIGITNIIPVFGPYFGAVPMALLILIESPAKCLIFVIFIIVLQQIDGNIIGPKVLGNSTGLSGFSVLFAIVLFGGLMGFIGLIVGVPLYAVIYDVARKLVNLGLKKHGREDLVEPVDGKRLKAKHIYD
ncbi:MAG: AI-2E family transporter [Firmicutes bacterium]|nr:AI-2E family transporter [Bacillota bacterium]MBR0522777.1 AI-2E family transporter [Bacillota bacterium]